MTDWTMQGTQRAMDWAASRGQQLSITGRAALDLATLDDPRRDIWGFDDTRLAIECQRRTLPWRIEMGTFYRLQWKLVWRSVAARRGWLTRRWRAAHR